MTMTGTSYFVSLAKAAQYYRDYGYSMADIERKVAAGEIHIGKPPLNRGEKLLIIDDGTRYAITA